METHEFQEIEGTLFKLAFMLAVMKLNKLYESFLSGGLSARNSYKTFTWTLIFNPFPGAAPQPYSRTSLDILISWMPRKKACLGIHIKTQRHGTKGATLQLSRERAPCAT